MQLQTERFTQPASTQKQQNHYDIGKFQNQTHSLEEPSEARIIYSIFKGDINGIKLAIIFSYVLHCSKISLYHFNI